MQTDPKHIGSGLAGTWYPHSQRHERFCELYVRRTGSRDHGAIRHGCLSDLHLRRKREPSQPDFQREYWESRILGRFQGGSPLTEPESGIPKSIATKMDAACRTTLVRFDPVGRQCDRRRWVGCPSECGYSSRWPLSRPRHRLSQRKHYRTALIGLSRFSEETSPDSGTIPTHRDQPSRKTRH